MRSFKEFKEFLEEGLISEDDDKKEEKKESKKDSEKESEKKDKDKKEDKKEKKEEEEIVLDRNEGYSFLPKIVFGPEAYQKHLDSLDKDDDEYEEKIKPMVYTFSFGGKYQAKFESIPDADTIWEGSLSKGVIPSDTKEQGLVLSTIMDILNVFSKGDMDANLSQNNIKEINFDIFYSNKNQLENFKKMISNLLVSSFKITSTHRERRKNFIISLRRN